MNRLLRTNQLILIGIGCAILYWVVESYLDTLVRGTFSARLFLVGDPHELWMRAITVALLIGFGAFAQLLTNKRKRTEEGVRRLNEELEERIEEHTARLDAALTDLQQRELTLRESEERYRLLVESARDYAIFMVNADGCIANWSTGAKRLFGYREEEIVGKPSSLLFTPEDIRSGAPERELREAAEEGRSEDERWHVRKNGSKFWASGFARPMRDEEGNLRGFVKVMRDITERKRAEQEQARLAAIVDSSDDVIISKTLEGIITSWNRGAQKIYGYSSEEVVGRPINILVPPERPDEIPSILNRVRRGEKVDHFETVRVTKDGRRLDISLTVSPIKDSRGNTVGASTIARDITERKQAQEVLERQARQAALRADVGAALAEGGSLSGLLQRCAEAMVGHLHAAFARVWSLNEKENVLELQASAGMYTHLDGPHSRVPVGALKIGLIAEERKPHLTNTVTTDPRVSDKQWARREGMVAFAGHPLVVEDRLVGVMAMFSREELAEDTLEALKSVADVIAQGIERKRAEEALRESEERFRLLAEEAVEGIALVEEGKIIDANPSFLEMFGYALEEIVGIDVVKVVHPDLREEVARRISTGDTQPYEARVLRKDGTIFPIEVRPRHIPYHGRRIRVTSVIDLTERKRSEEAMREVREAERRRLARDLHDGVLQDLSYAVQAMEITKLNAEGTGVEEELQQEVDALRSAAQELRAAVHNLRLADELDQPFPRLLESLVERNREMARGQQIELEVKEGFPSVPLGEAGMELLRIIREALTNARRHSGAKRVLMRLRTEEDDLVAEVSEDGRGFGPEATPGVGLRSMRERAASLGGELEVESEPGQGTTVRLRVPMPRRP